METSVNLLVGLSLLGICITSSFAFPPKHDTQHALFKGRQITGSQDSKNAHHEQQNAATEKQDRVNTVSVMCHPDSMEIVVKADMFDVGAPIDGDELRLGVEHVDFCRATATSHDEYRIIVGLLDCGTKHWMTEDSLIYTNLLIYSPMASPDGVIRMDEAVIPIECHYGRKYSLSSSSLTPTWIPFTSTQAAVETLDFGLSIMTSDWLYERSSNVFYLGQPINIEASVRVGHHMGLRVFVSSCVATLSPDRDTVPRYIFIENNGCLVDSQLQGSNSKFLPRTQDDKLQLVIDAFRFHQEDRGELYITCHLNAVPLNDAESQDKACTFINGRWRSADGNDYLCGYCQSQNEVGQTHSMPGSYGTLGPRGFGKPGVPEALWRSGLKADKVWEQEASVGPMLVLPARQKSGPLPVEELPPLLSKISRPALYGSQWRSGINFKTGPLDSVHEDGDFRQRGLFAVKDLEKGLLPTPEQRLGDLTTKMLLANGSQQDKGDRSHMDLGKSGTDLKGGATEDKDVTPLGNATLGITLNSMAAPDMLSHKADIRPTAAPSEVRHSTPVQVEDNAEEDVTTLSNTTAAESSLSDKENPKK